LEIDSFLQVIVPQVKEYIVPAKEFWKSKTMWFNILAVLVFVASQVGFADFRPDADMLAVVAALVNLLLRFVTKEPVKLK
jgi:hypothetical protein